MVARATLMAFDEPSDLHSTSWTPASSRMTRAAPPAMTPVPGAAGFSSTRPAPVSPMTGWVMVRAGERHVEQVLLGLFGALLDGQRHLLGLAVAEADPAVAVADHDERGEREPTTALDDLGDAVDVDDPRLAQPAGVDGAVVGGVRNSLTLPSELQTCFAGGVGDRGDAAVVEEPTAVEHDLARRRRPWPARRRALPTLGWPRRRSRRCRRRAGRPRPSRRRPACGRRRRRSPAATMCLFERNTARRGRAAVPWIFLRTRRWRMTRPCATLLCDLAHRLLTSCRSCRPCGGPARRRSGRPCPCRARACGSSGCWRPPGRRLSLSMPVTIDARRRRAPRR